MRAWLLALAACSYPRPADVAPEDANGNGSDDAPDVNEACPKATAPQMFASCDGLVKNCGQVSGADCCESPVVPGGNVLRGFDSAADGAYPDNSHAATLCGYRLDGYEITVGRFRAFVASGNGTQASPPSGGAGAHPYAPGTGWDDSWNANLAATTNDLIDALECSTTFQTWTITPFQNETRPMNCITWYEAMAFCIWDGGFLPTEAEWNYAAAGGSAQRAYPWSDPADAIAIDETRASYWVDATKQCYGNSIDGCDINDLSSVGKKAAGNGLFGHADMAGNVSEWVLDAYGDFPMPCSDCVATAPATLRGVRGGSFNDDALVLRTSARGFFDPSFRFATFGARCARVR